MQGFDFSQKNALITSLACFDIIQRLNEVTYVNQLEVIGWAHREGVDIVQFNKTRNDVYNKAQKVINSPTT